MVCLFLHTSFLSSPTKREREKESERESSPWADKNKGATSISIRVFVFCRGTFSLSSRFIDGISDRHFVDTSVPFQDIGLTKSSIAEIFYFRMAYTTRILDYLGLTLDRMPHENDMKQLWIYIEGGNVLFDKCITNKENVDRILEPRESSTKTAHFIY